MLVITLPIVGTGTSTVDKSELELAKLANLLLVGPYLFQPPFHPRESNIVLVNTTCMTSQLVGLPDEQSALV